MEDRYYRLSWSSVDGAGSDEEKFADLQTAIEQADTAQAIANQDDNEWGYCRLT